jgi:hypothetical protein
MTQWFHLFVLHALAWASFILVMDVYRNGVKTIQGMILMSIIGALVSSHGHMHYLTYFSEICSK